MRHTHHWAGSRPVFLFTDEVEIGELSLTLMLDIVRQDVVVLMHVQTLSIAVSKENNLHADSFLADTAAIWEG